MSWKTEEILYTKITKLHDKQYVKVVVSKWTISIIQAAPAPHIPRAETGRGTGHDVIKFKISVVNANSTSI